MKYFLMDLGLLMTIFMVAQVSFFSWQWFVLCAATIGHAMLHSFLGRRQGALASAVLVKQYHEAAKKYVAHIEGEKK